MSNYTQPQFHLYRNKPTEELVKLLQSDSATVTYKSKVVLESRIAIFTKKFQAPIKLIHSIHTLNYEKIELAFHQYYYNKRKIGEWFALDETDIELIKQNMFPKEIQILIPDKMPHIHTVQ